MEEGSEIREAETQEEENFLDYLERPPEDLEQYNHEIYKRHLESVQDTFTENGINPVEKEQAVKSLAEQLTNTELKGEVDALTGILNRNGFERVFNSITSESERTGQEASILIIDLNDLKKINDRDGHDKGDEYITKATSALRENTRQGDALCRIGGDEFALIINNLNIEKDQELRERLASTLTNEDVTASIGGSLIDVKSPGSSMKKADENLYEAKKESKKPDSPDFGKTLFYTSTNSQSDQQVA